MPRGFQATKKAEVGSGYKRVPDFDTVVFQCPLCSWGDWTGRCAVVRTQVRGVTLGCLECGVQFTMTWHRLAQATRRLVNERRTPWDLDEWRDFAALFQELAPEETRGRRKSKSR